jgi:hypothetical protein
VADAIYAGIKGVQAAATDPVLDRPIAPPNVFQLPPSHNPVLSLRKRGEPTVVIARPQKRFFSDRFCGLGGRGLH